MKTKRENPFKSAPVLVVDFDGTLIRQDLGKLFSEWLINQKFVSSFHLFWTLPLGLANSVSRYFFEFPLCNRVLMPIPDGILSTSVVSFIEIKSPAIDVNEPLLEFVAKFSGTRILLTGSPEILVAEFLRQKRIDCFDSVIGQSRGRLGWFLNPTPFGRRKSGFIKSSIQIAISNDRTDRHLFRRAARAILMVSDIENTPNWSDPELVHVKFGYPIDHLVIGSK